MTRIRVAVILGFVLAFAAGASVGLLASMPGEATASRPGRGPDLTAQLGLTSEQQAQMRTIWSEFVAVQDKEFHDRKRTLWQEKDEAIEGLLTDEQRAEYDAICADCDRRMREMDEKWQDVIQQAVERTKAMLTPEQVKKYDEFRTGRQTWRTRKGGGDSRGSSRFSPGGRGPERSGFPATATAPADGNTPRP
jgi:hypothetical protein